MFYIYGIIEHVTFWAWCFLLSMILWRFLQVVACINNVLFSGWVAFQGRNVLLFVNHLPVERQRNCFQFSAIMNKDAVNFQCTVLFKHKFSFLLAKCPRVQLLDYRLPVYFYKKLVKVFSSLAVSFCIFTSSVWMNEFLFIFSSIFF